MDVIDILLNLQAELRKSDGYQITDIQDVRGNYMINCPFHGGGREKNPSFGILKEDKHTAQGRLEKGFGNCFACGARMSLDKLVETTLHLGENDGEQWLKAYGYTKSADTLYSSLTSLTIDKEQVRVSQSEYTKGYHPYMGQRGLTPNIANIFDLGYTDTSIVIPIKDRHGVARMLIHRFINPINGRKFHNTAGADKEHLLHGRWELMQHPEAFARGYLIVVESSIDMMLLWQHGHPAVATMQAIPTASQLKQINSLPIDQIIIATDNDTAGESAISHYLENLKDKDIFRLEYLPEEKDIGDLTNERLNNIHAKILQAKKVSAIEILPVG